MQEQTDTGLFAGGPMRELTGEEQHALDTFFNEKEHVTDAELSALRAVADAARRYFTALDDPEGDTRTTRDELRAAIAKAEPHA